MSGQRLRDYKKIKSDDDVLNRVQDQIAYSIAQLIRTEPLDGRLIPNVSLTAGANSVEHKLGRDLRGWIVVRKRANANIWDEQDSNTRSSLFLNLQTSADVTVDLWVF